MSRIIELQHGVSDSELGEVVDALKAGEVIIAPTDTLYGLLADAFQESAVQKVYRLKQRPGGMPLPLIAASDDQVAEVVRLNSLARRLAERFWPGPLTLALPAREQVPHYLRAEDGTLAIRIPAHPVCRRLAHGVGRPLTATSANLSGQPAARAPEDIPRSMAEQVFAILSQGRLAADRASTIVKVEENRYRVVREGAIPVEAIQSRLGEDIFEGKE